MQVKMFSIIIIIIFSNFVVVLCSITSIISVTLLQLLNYHNSNRKANSNLCVSVCLVPVFFWAGSVVGSGRSSCGTVRRHCTGSVPSRHGATKELLWHRSLHTP